ncbi:MAG: antA/AntB antirepressor family protein [Synergistaceae bacterium]|nr:antA/AntB antirepressor family protein [Synergistaceae bacterium]
MDGMDGLKVVESGLVPVYEDNKERRLVNARELHVFLESRQDFSVWIKARLEKYGFVSDEDYSIILGNRDGDGIGRAKTEYLLTIDTAKEISMVENNAKGRQVRKYFIECEKRLKAVGGAISARDAEKLKQQAKRLEIMDRNSRSRQAQILKSVAEFFKDILSDASMRAIAGEMTALVSGERLVEAPGEVEKLYSAGEIGEMCGISGNMVGRIANEHGLKVKEFGKFVLDKSPYSAKQVTTFRYKQKVTDRIREIFDTLKGCVGDVTSTGKSSPSA